MLSVASVSRCHLPNLFKGLFVENPEIFTTSVRNASRLRTKHVRNPLGYWYQRMTPPALQRSQAIDRLEAGGEARFEKIAPALTFQSSSVFYDPLVNKFTNMIMMGGNKQLADDIMEQVFEIIKRTQLEKYHCAAEDEKFKIEMNPWKIFHSAVENSKPVLALMPLKRGGVTYQVPVSVTDKRAEWTALKWLILAARDSKPRSRMVPVGERHVPIWEAISNEILNAFNNEGRVVKRKHDLHKQCEANKAYAHYRWSR